MGENNKSSEDSSIKNNPQPQQLSTEYRNLHVRPWTRFFARYIDIYIFGFILVVFSTLFYPSFLSENDLANGLIILFCWFLVEPVFLSTLGTTFGKFLLNIKICDVNGCKPKFHNAFSRSFWVWCAGFGFGIPIVYLFTLYSSYSRLKNTGTTSWDKDHFIITHSEVGYVRGAIAFILIASALGFSIWNKSHEYYQKAIYSSPSNYSSEIEKQNKTLPQMVDSETEFTKMYFENNTLNYQYRLITKDVNDMNKSMFYDYMRNQIITKACDKSSPNDTLSRGFNLSFNYTDKNGLPIANILIKPTDCK